MYSKNMLQLLVHLADIGPTPVCGRTMQALVNRGLAERYVPEATTYAAAARGRVRYYRITPEGMAVVASQRPVTPEDRHAR